MTTKPKQKRPPRVLVVRAVQRVTPHMIRVTLHSPEIGKMVDGCEGANCKLFLPHPGQPREDFERQLIEGPRPTVRTYTVRYMRSKDCEMDIDFVDHGDGGPASVWARKAKPGDVCGFAGPGLVKVQSFYADSYLIVADMSALPVASATLEAMPSDAKGHAFFEIMDKADQQYIAAPDGISQHWIVKADPHQPSEEILRKVRSLKWPSGTVQTCVAGESAMIKDLRVYLNVDRQVPRADTYISGYWKIGLIEDEHQKMKRTEDAAMADTPMS